ncbi:hypothetical protein [Aquimarina algiphila]|uniref:hypothetical protein n=1 Tax=Aquimarina algiphila TaxID=2047982 RepID=UPI002490CBE3|nr:hypothetical protein [Aquimarina algiphila]
MRKTSILASLIISGLFILLGTYDYFSRRSISLYFDNIQDDLGYSIIRPAKLFGIMARFIGNYIYDSDLFFVLGQLLGFVIYSCLIWVFIMLLKVAYKKVK